MLKYKAGIGLVHVPYKGISLAVPAVMAGEVQLTFAGIASSLAPLKSGRVKPLAIGGGERPPLLPPGPALLEPRSPHVHAPALRPPFLPAGGGPARGAAHPPSKTNDTAHAPALH